MNHSVRSSVGSIYVQMFLNLIRLELRKSRIPSVMILIISRQMHHPFSTSYKQCILSSLKLDCLTSNSQMPLPFGMEDAEKSVVPKLSSKVRFISKFLQIKISIKKSSELSQVYFTERYIVLIMTFEERKIISRKFTHN